MGVVYENVVFELVVWVHEKVELNERDNDQN